MARRSNINLNSGQSRRGTVKNSVRRNSIPRIQSGAAGTEGLNTAFSQFFNKVGSSFEMLSDVDHQRKVVEAQKQNVLEKKQGASDQRFGTIDQTMLNDLDYVEGMETQLGTDVGNRLAAMVTKFAEDVPLNVDSRTQVDAFMRKVLEDEKIDSIHASFSMSKVVREAADRAIIQHDAKRSAKRLNDGIDRTVGNIVTAFSKDPGGFNAKSLNKAADDLKQVSPQGFGLDAKAKGAPGNPKLHVINNLIAAAESPKELSALTRTLSEEGSGVDGKSFVTSFPEQGEAILVKMRNKARQANTMAELEAADKVTNAINQVSANPGASMADLAAVGKLVDTYRTTYAAQGKAQALTGALATATKSILEREVGINNYDALVTGQPTSRHLNRGDITKWQAEKWNQKGSPNPDGTVERISLTNTKTMNQAATEAAKVGFLNKSSKDELSVGLTSYTSDPAGAAVAYQGARLLFDKVSNKETFNDLVGQKTTDVFYAVDLITKTSNKTVEQAFAELAQRSPSAFKPSDLKWVDVVDKDKEEDAQKEVNELLTNELKGMFNADSVSGEVMSAMRDSVKMFISTYGNKDNWKDFARARLESAFAGRDLNVELRHGKTVVTLAHQDMGLNRMATNVVDPGDPLTIISTQDIVTDALSWMASGMSDVVGDDDAVSVTYDAARKVNIISHYGRPVTIPVGREFKFEPKNESDIDWLSSISEVFQSAQGRLNTEPEVQALTGDREADRQLIKRAIPKKYHNVFKLISIPDGISGVGGYQIVIDMTKLPMTKANLQQAIDKHVSVDELNQTQQIMP